MPKNCILITRLARLQIEQAFVVVGDSVGAAHVRENLGAVRVAAGLVIRKGAICLSWGMNY